jgi:hypothetical protein
MMKCILYCPHQRLLFYLNTNYSTNSLYSTVVREPSAVRGFYSQNFSSRRSEIAVNLPKFLDNFDISKNQRHLKVVQLRIVDSLLASSLFDQLRRLPVIMNVEFSQYGWLQT